MNLFKNTLSMQGIEVRFADPKDPKNFEKLTDEKTRAYYGESCPNPVSYTHLTLPTTTIV